MTLARLNCIYPQLYKYKDSRTVEALIRLLNIPFSEVSNVEENAAIRFWSAKLLGEIGDLRAVKPLIQVVESQFSQFPPCEAWNLYGYAAEALGKLGDPRAIKSLEKLIERCRVKDPTQSLGKVATNFRSKIFKVNRIANNNILTETRNACVVFGFYIQILFALLPILSGSEKRSKLSALDDAKLALNSLRKNEDIGKEKSGV